MTAAPREIGIPIECSWLAQCSDLEQLWLSLQYVLEGLTLMCADVEDDNTTVRRGSVLGRKLPIY